MNEPDQLILTNQKKQILKAISGEITLPPVTRMYVLGLIFTALAILLLPILYLTLMLLIIGCLIWTLLHAGVMLADWPWMIKWTLICFVVCIGLACLLGLVKPFFARSSRILRPRTLSRDAEPFLYEYIDRLCSAIGARRPAEIHVTCDLNAAAEFRPGWQNVLGGREVSLYLGLPLIAGLTLRQFTGVLAHELGHFTQRIGMQVENIVRRTNLWFYRAAHERDRIDDWLEYHTSLCGLSAIPCHLACLIVWISRRVLLGLAKAGTAIGCLMSRQMELNADQYQTRIVGSRTLTSTLLRMQELSLAHQISFRDIAIFYDEGRLPDDIAALTVANTSFITRKMKKKIRRMMAEEKTGLFDSHPSDQDRIVAATTNHVPGFIPQGSLPDYLPASILFNQFGDVSKALTKQFLENALNQKIKPRMLNSVDKLLERQSVQIIAAKALWRYFQTDIPLLRPLPIPCQAMEPPENLREIADELKSSRERMMQELTEYKRLTSRYRAAEETLFETIAAQSLIQAQLPFTPTDYHLADANPDTAAEKNSRAREAVASLASKLLPFESEAGNRLSFAMQLIHVPSIMQQIVNGDELQYEIKELLPEAKCISQLVGELPLLQMVMTRLQALQEPLSTTQLKEQNFDFITNDLAFLHSCMTSTKESLGDRLYPFDHAKAETTLGEYVIPHIPKDRNFDQLVKAAEQMQSRLITVQIRLFARLAQAAEQIEAVIGLPPLPDPQRDVDD